MAKFLRLVVHGATFIGSSLRQESGGQVWINAEMITSIVIQKSVICINYLSGADKRGGDQYMLYEADNPEGYSAVLRQLNSLEGVL